MPFDPERMIPIRSGHEIRRDFVDRFAEARPVAEAKTVAPLWSLLPRVPMDVLWARPVAPEVARFGAGLEGLFGAIAGLVLVSRSALTEVIGELPASDACGGSLRRLLGGQALYAFGHLLLAFDDERHPCIGWVGFRREVLPLIQRFLRLADETLPVLLTGETGTGKEVAARALHELGRRRGRTWMAINCAEIPESLLESELFGHVRGSFTGAASDRAGLFEASGDGTAFLDEIGELPLSAQAKLLRILEDHHVRRLGSSRPTSLRCRIVAATNRDLTHEIERRRFRPDLFYRLRGATISLPALRDRACDILPLADSFLARAAFRFRRPPIDLSEEARLALLSHDWPGNVRELRLTIEAASLASLGRRIVPSDLGVPAGRSTVVSEPAPLLTVHALERAHILRALTTTSGNKMAAARLLGLTRQSLQRRIERHRILLPAAIGRHRPDPAPETERHAVSTAVQTREER